MGETALADKHRQLHDRYRVDDVARSKAVEKARAKYPAANAAAEALVIYSLHRAGAPGLPALADR